MGRRQKLLLVEPEKMVAAGMSMFLTELGYEVCGIARNAAEGLRLTKLHHPILALVDMQLEPACDGLGMARELDRRHGVPSVLITDRLDPRLTCNTFVVTLLSKPFAPEHLTQAVEAGLDWLRYETMADRKGPGRPIPWRRRH